jgi:hypothetical protein
MVKLERQDILVPQAKRAQLVKRVLQDNRVQLVKRV